MRFAEKSETHLSSSKFTDVFFICLNFLANLIKIL
jgi:hypothetical protein